MTLTMLGRVAWETCHDARPYMPNKNQSKLQYFSMGITVIPREYVKIVNTVDLGGDGDCGVRVLAQNTGYSYTHIVNTLGTSEWLTDN